MLVGAGLVGLALVAGVGLGPHMGFTAGPKTPLWTERAVNVAPTQVQAPNWVELAKELKPAVVNVSTKRVESGPADARALRQRRSVRAVLPAVR